MLYPKSGGRQGWFSRTAGWVGAAVGFAVLSYGIGSVLLARLAPPAGVLVAITAGVGYAVLVRVVIARCLEGRGQAAPGRGVLRRGSMVQLSAPARPEDPR
ncbi:hypothetical protein B0I08_10673 [Glaciihabitans tibetensis]|uniref:Uncharacterized protein n=1 Tax=Glaciihabitans tibetensis TaxID=1266600 RepID=A0A2T0VB89_9MICO|nr:hypothetical protein B0I08_10673 [Glaciihabitans tibetensis]